MASALAVGFRHAATRPSGSGPMSKTKACPVLGLEPGAGPQQKSVKRTERLLKTGPPRRWIDFLASKINEAKDILSRLTFCIPHTIQTRDYNGCSDTHCSPRSRWRSRSIFFFLSSLHADWASFFDWKPANHAVRRRPPFATVSVSFSNCANRPGAPQQALFEQYVGRLPAKARRRSAPAIR